MANGQIRRQIKKRAPRLNLLQRITGIKLITLVALISAAAAGYVAKSIGTAFAVYFAIMIVDKLISKSKNKNSENNDKK